MFCKVRTRIHRVIARYTVGTKDYSLQSVTVEADMNYRGTHTAELTSRSCDGFNASPIGGSDTSEDVTFSDDWDSWPGEAGSWNMSSDSTAGCFNDNKMPSNRRMRRTRRAFSCKRFSSDLDGLKISCTRHTNVLTLNALLP